jgi:hypothetical protein
LGPIAEQDDRLLGAIDRLNPEMERLFRILWRGSDQKIGDQGTIGRPERLIAAAVRALIKTPLVPRLRTHKRRGHHRDPIGPAIRLRSGAHDDGV